LKVEIRPMLCHSDLLTNKKKTQLSLCSVNFERITILVQVSSKISDFTPCAHAQNNILLIKYAEKTDD